MKMLLIINIIDEDELNANGILLKISKKTCMNYILNIVIYIEKQIQL
jgi:hypothetical protein